MELPSRFAKYSDLFEKMTETTLLLDINTFKVVDANPASFKFLELKPEQILGESVFRWVNEHEREGFETALKTASGREQPVEINCRFQNERRSFLVVQAVLCTLKLSNGSEVLQLIVKDVTEEHEAKQKSVNQLIKIAEMNRRLETLSVTDELTQLNNFRHFKDKLLTEHRRSARYGLSYSVLFCDVDHFKNYNDKNGHVAGDEVLKQLAQMIQASARSTDLVARYGGEEFVIICPETIDTNARVLAERLRVQIETFAFPFAEKQPLGKMSISIGIASYPNDGKTAEEIVQAADQAVYSAKSSGRNSVILARSIDKTQLPESKKKLEE